MITTVFTKDKTSTVWLDGVAPTNSELSKIAEDNAWPIRFVQDCLDSSHLPKFELLSENVSEGGGFAIFRSFDENADPWADSIQGLTRKVAVFIRDGFFITLHRTDETYFQSWRAVEVSRKEPNSPYILLLNLMEAIVSSYRMPLLKIRERLDEIEEGMLSTRSARAQDRVDILEESYYLKRRLSVIKRMLNMLQDINLKVLAALDGRKIHGLKHSGQTMKDSLIRIIFEADELSDHLNGLLNLHLSLSSFRTNEVMRVLTLFSVFFMPLTFIVGIYGMNFKFMPELEWHFGYWSVWIVMIIVSGVIFKWFRKQKWL
jgi:magnesium transporter